MPRIAQSKEVLVKRLRRFFEDVPEERQPVVSFVKSIKGASDVFIFGGLVREICLRGILPFRSDVDIVVKIQDRSEFDSFLSIYNCTKNKFGGYRIRESRWIIDIWEFENTWAFSQGLVSPIGSASLLQTTFFDWDAALYDFYKDRLQCSEDYIANISNKVLEINLEENPNEIGAFIRTLRFLLKERARTGYKLSKFIQNSFLRMSDQEIMEYERGHFPTVSLTKDILATLRDKSIHWAGEKVFPWMPERQFNLFNSTE